MDPVTLGTQTAKALAEAQNVQQILAIVAGALVAALLLLAYLHWSESKDRRAELKAAQVELKHEQEARRVEVRELFEMFTARIETLAKALDSEHDRGRGGVDSGSGSRHV